MIGGTVGAYRIVSEIGRGGMGVVYLARHRFLDRQVAIKVLHGAFTERSELLERIFREARATSLVDHEGIVKVIDCGLTDDGLAYIVMEYVCGQTLRAYLTARGRIPFPEASAIILRIADALKAAHGVHIVHRDLKPDNIFRLSEPAGGIKIVDFGIAKVTSLPGGSSRTQSGKILGTPLYMSPEQARGHGLVDARADIYSLGCIFFELLCGRPPFLHAGPGELIAAHIGEAPPTVASLEPSVPPDLSVVVDLMLAKSPEWRPGNLDELTSVLRTFAVTEAGASDPSAFATLPFDFQPPTGPEVQAAPQPGPADTIPDIWIDDLEDEPPPPPPKRSKRVVVGVAVAGAAAIALTWGLRRSEPSPTAMALTPVTPARLPPAAAPPPVNHDQPQPPPTPKPNDPPRMTADRHRPATPRGRKEMASTHRETRPAAARTVDPLVAVTITSEPSGATVCLADGGVRLGITDGTFKVKRGKARGLFVYHPGYHVERIALAGTGNDRRALKLRRLGEDDLQEPPPCP